MTPPPVATNARKWTGLLWRLFALAAIFILLSVGLTIALIAQHSANHTSDCVNGILATRNGPSLHDTNAQINYLRADRMYNNALDAVFNAPQGSAEQARLFEVFKKIAAKKEAIVDRSLDTFIHDRSLRNAKPLGRC